MVKLNAIALIALITLASAVQLYHSATLCPTKNHECFYGYDTNTYVALTENGTYIDPNGRQPIPAEEEAPVAIFLMRLNPIRFADKWLGFYIFMLAVSITSGLAVYFLARKLNPGTELFAMALWLFNPLNYRIFLDLAQNNLVNLMGLVFLCWVVYRKELAERSLMFNYTPIILAVLMLYTHQFAFWWLLVAATLALLGAKRWRLTMLVSCVILVAGMLGYGASYWRFALMLALPLTLFLSDMPKVTRFFLFVTTFTFYLLMPGFFTWLNAL